MTQASDIDQIYNESFFCGCQPSSLDGRWVRCPFFPKAELDDGYYKRLRLMPLNNAGAAGVCSGDLAPANCDTSALEEALQNDLYNWLPVTAAVHENLVGRTFIDIATELSPSTCDLELSDNVPAAEPPNHLKGDIARRILYLIGRYNISVPDPYLRMLIYWDANDPVSELEYRVSRKIAELQKSDNAFVTFRYERTQKQMRSVTPEVLH